VTIDRETLASLTGKELEHFVSDNPNSRALYERARKNLVGGVPMPWMMRWAGGFPVFATEASGARITDVDGHTYVDLCLGDTGSMPGHSPEHHDDAPDRECGLGRGGDGPPVRT
jgi:glutamate-1-semialdehyde 2,1-aminomutase